MASNSTTVQLKKSTIEKLKALKKDQNAASYDEVIEYLLKKEQDIPASLFGFLRNEVTPFTHDVQDMDHE